MDLRDEVQTSSFQNTQEPAKVLKIPVSYYRDLSCGRTQDWSRKAKRKEVFICSLLNPKTESCINWFSASTFARMGRWSVRRKPRLSEYGCQQIAQLNTLPSWSGGHSTFLHQVHRHFLWPLARLAKLLRIVRRNLVFGHHNHRVAVDAHRHNLAPSVICWVFHRGRIYFDESEVDII